MTRAPGKGEALPLPEILERLRSPFVFEEFSCLTGAPLLVVDVSVEATDVSDFALAAARTALADLACPTVALHATSASPAGEALLDRFDLALADGDALAAVARAVERRPLASLGLVQVLRHGEALDVGEGLVAESLVYATLQAGPEFAEWIAAQPARESPAPNPEPAVLSRRDGARLRLTVNRPERHNAYSAERRDALCEALALAVADPSLEAIVLDGAGASFSSGGDLVEFGTRPDPATAHAIRSTRSAGRLLASCAPRLVVEVHGACVGAGIELPAFAGRVVARPGSTFALPEVGMGLVPGAGGTVSIPHRIGRQRTAWLALTGESLDADTALAWGLVDEVADA